LPHPVQILCDFDGTIALDDVTDALLETLAAPGWEALEQDWREGRIGSRTCMTHQVGLIWGNWADLDSVIDRIPVDPDFKAFAKVCGALNVPIIIVSDGLDYPIRRILAREGLGLPVRANHLRRRRGGTWALETPHAASACRADAAHCKCTSLASAAGTRSIVVGDGRSDACVAEHADFVFAKDLASGPSTLLKACRDLDLPHLPFKTFADVTQALPALLAAHPCLAPRGEAVHTREFRLQG
jgi:2-hydroxy-3-keto-5-methylthiopentenyl-1-phosphate phosphatase